MHFVYFQWFLMILNDFWLIFVRFCWFLVILDYFCLILYRKTRLGWYIFWEESWRVLVVVDKKVQNVTLGGPMRLTVARARVFLRGVFQVFSGGFSRFPWISLFSLFSLVFCILLKFLELFFIDFCWLHNFLIILHWFCLVLVGRYNILITGEPWWLV